MVRDLTNVKWHFQRVALKKVSTISINHEHVSYKSLGVWNARTAYLSHITSLSKFIPDNWCPLPDTWRQHFNDNEINEGNYATKRISSD